MPALATEPDLAKSMAQAYAVIPRLLNSIQQSPQCNDARIAGATAFAKLGLRSAMEELLEPLDPSIGGVAVLHAALAELSDDRVDTTPQSHLFRSNMAALSAKSPSIAKLQVDLERSLRSLQLHRCIDGEMQLSRRIGNGPRRWLPTIAPWKTNTRSPKLIPPAGSHFCPPYVLDGIGTGELLDHVRTGTAKMFLTFSPRIHVLEANLSALAAWMCIADWQDIIADPRVHFWIGSDAAERLGGYYRVNLDLAVPTQVIRSPDWGAKLDPPAERVMRELNQSIDAAVNETRAAIIAQRGTDTPRLAVDGVSGLRVLGITSRFTTFLQHSMRDTGQALAARGHEFRLLLERDDHTHGVPPLHMLRQIHEFQPDLILVIDHNRVEYGRTLDLPIPFCNWIQDELPHLFDPGSGRHTRADDLIVGLISSRSARLAGYPKSQICYLPVPVNERVFSSVPCHESTLAPVRCDISFVSNLSITIDRFVEDYKAQDTRRELHRLVDALRDTLEAMIAIGDTPCTQFAVEHLIQETGRRVGLEIPCDSAAKLRRNCVDRMINIFFRQQPLVWAAETGLDLHLYGRGWESHPKLGRFARGVAEHGAHLRSIFQGSRINLQLYPIPGIHQRLLEGLLSGGFFMIRGTRADAVAPLYQSAARRAVQAGITNHAQLASCGDSLLIADVTRLYEVLTGKQPQDDFVDQLHDFHDWAWKLDMPTALPNYDEVRFDAQADFVNLVSRYLSDDERRRAVAESQRQFVLQHFTYDRAVSDILAFGRSRLKKSRSASLKNSNS